MWLHFNFGNEGNALGILWENLLKDGKTAYMDIRKSRNGNRDIMVPGDLSINRI